MGWSGSEQACKNHPCHDLKQGICPSCLRERLSQLILVTSQYHDDDSTVAMARSCSSSSLSSSSPSNPNWVPAAHRLHQRRGSEVVGSISFKVSVDGDLGLKKSRSMAFVSRTLAGDVKNGKKKTGFWSKLLRLKGKKGRLDGFSDYGKKAVLDY